VSNKISKANPLVTHFNSMKIHFNGGGKRAFCIKFLVLLLWFPETEYIFYRSAAGCQYPLYSPLFLQSPTRMKSDHLIKILCFKSYKWKISNKEGVALFAKEFLEGHQRYHESSIPVGFLKIILKDRQYNLKSV
jgi:hypothetical protein